MRRLWFKDTRFLLYKTESGHLLYNNSPMINNTVFMLKNSLRGLIKCSYHKRKNRGSGKKLLKMITSLGH